MTTRGVSLECISDTTRGNGHVLYGLFHCKPNYCACALALSHAVLKMSMEKENKTPGEREPKKRRLSLKRKSERFAKKSEEEMDIIGKGFVPQILKKILVGQKSVLWSWCMN